MNEKYAYIPHLSNRKQSPFFTNVSLPQKKKVKREKNNINDALRKSCWAMHAEPLKKTMTCIGCGTKSMHKDRKGDWEASHINAECWHRKSKNAGPLTKYDLVPLCHGCNKTMATKCLWDWLYENGRTKYVKKLCFRIYKVYREEHAQEMGFIQDMCWRLIVKKLHGSERFTKGGGISKQNEHIIIKILKIHQIQQVENEMGQLMEQLKKKTRLIQQLLK
jgi:hypothetical protein